MKTTFRMRWLPVVVVLLVLPSLSAQDTKSNEVTAAEQFQTKIKAAAKKIRDAKLTKTREEARTVITEQFGSGVGGQLFALALVLRSERDFVQMIEEVRVDKQVGGSDANAGSTSLVAKGSVPSILGFAVENGALLREESGTTITFRGNPLGIVKALREKGYIASYRDVDPGARFLRRFSFALSFDASRGQMPGTFTGDRQQLSSYSFHVDILNKRDPREASFGKDWTDLIRTQGLELGAAMNRLFQQFEQDPAVREWMESAQAAILEAPSEKTEDVIKSQLLRLQDLPLPSAIETDVARYRRAVNLYLSSRANLLNEAVKKPIVTFEYTNIREPDGPDLSNLKFIAEFSSPKGAVDFTANGSFTLFNSIPAGTNLKRVRDAQVSGQLDIPLGQVQKVGSFVLSFSGKYERMREDAMMGGMMVPDTKGDIGIGQLKLTIPVKGSGVKIPLSITFANRTELIKEKEVRGNFGLTFDLDTILARLNP